MRTAGRFVFLWIFGSAILGILALCFGEWEAAFQCFAAFGMGGFAYLLLTLVAILTR
jgi:hypothetical protein